jgi:hypothetical protein
MASSRREREKKLTTQTGKEEERTSTHHNQWQVDKYLIQKQLKAGEDLLSVLY